MPALKPDAQLHASCAAGERGGACRHGARPARARCPASSAALSAGGGGPKQLPRGARQPGTPVRAGTAVGDRRSVVRCRDRLLEAVLEQSRKAENNSRATQIWSTCSVALAYTLKRQPGIVVHSALLGDKINRTGQKLKPITNRILPGPQSLEVCCSFLTCRALRHAFW